MKINAHLVTTLFTAVCLVGTIVINSSVNMSQTSRINSLEERSVPVKFLGQFRGGTFDLSFVYIQEDTYKALRKAGAFPQVDENEVLKRLQESSNPEKIIGLSPIRIPGDFIGDTWAIYTEGRGWSLIETTTNYDHSFVVAVEDWQ